MTCYFNMRSKADIKTVSLIYCMEPTTKKWKRRTKKQKRICSEVLVTVWGIHVVSPEEEKEGYSGKTYAMYDKYKID